MKLANTWLTETQKDISELRTKVKGIDGQELLRNKKIM